jgi:hypothetical protein
MSLAEITARLDDQLELLRIKRGVVPHQRSIAAAIDWSYELLDSEARHTLALLGAFPTGTIAHDAAGVVLQSDAPADALGPLVDASLLARSSEDADTYVMLEPIRQYAEAKLVEAGEHADARLRHAQWIVRECEGVNDAYLRGDFASTLRMLRDRGPAMAATARWAVQSGRPDITLAIIAAIGRRWPDVADPEILIVPGMAALATDPPAPTDVRIRATAVLAFLNTMDRPDDALRLLDDALTEAGTVDDLEPMTRFTLSSLASVIPARVNRLGWASTDELELMMAHLDRSIEIAVEMGYPPETHWYSRAVTLELAGDVQGARDVLDRLCVWAGHDRPVLRGLALHMIAKRQLLDGDGEAGLSSAAEAAALLVEAGDLDFAAEAEYMLAHGNAELERFSAAQESIERIDEYHRQVGLPPAAEEDPDLDAEVAAGLGHWDRFLVAASAFVDSIPPTDELDARAFFLEGEPGNTSRVARMIPPTVRYLAAHGQPEAAANLVASIDAVAEQSADPDVHRTVGLVGRTAGLADELGLPAPTGAITSPELAFAAIHEAVKGTAPVVIAPS